MRPAHRGKTTMSRRALLGAGAALAVAGVVVGAHHLGSSGPSSGPSSSPSPGPSSPAGGSPSPVPSPAPSGGGPSARTPAPGGKPAWGGPVPFEPGRVMLGAYLDLSGMSFDRALALRRRQLGRGERIVHLFYDFTDPLPSSLDDLPAGAVPLISWRGAAYPSILGGGSDQLVKAAARNLSRLRRPVFLRWGWEMNGNWYPWSGPANNGNPQGYVDCWRRLHRIFAEQGARNVAWVWSVNWNSHPATAANRFPLYYPGDGYVDWVGLSGYNLGHESPHALYDPLYDAYASRKPVFITEVGAADFGGSTKGDFIRRFAAYVDGRPAIGAVTWFDTDTHPNAPYNWRIDANPDSLAAYKAMATSPRFAG